MTFFSQLIGLIVVSMVLVIFLFAGEALYASIFDDAPVIPVPAVRGFERLVDAILNVEVGTPRVVSMAISESVLVGKVSESKDPVTADGTSIVLDSSSCVGKICLCIYGSKDDLNVKNPLCAELKNVGCVYSLGSNQRNLVGQSFDEREEFIYTQWENVPAKGDEIKPADQVQTTFTVSINPRFTCPNGEQGVQIVPHVASSAQSGSSGESVTDQFVRNLFD